MNAMQAQGPSANIKQGDSLTAWDLLHAVILLNANDAATVVAEKFGQLLYDSAMGRK